MTSLRIDVGEAMQVAIATLAPVPDCARIADALALWIAAGDDVTLEAALGLGATWRSVRRRRKRDAMIVEMAARIDGSDHYKALAVARQLPCGLSARSIRRLLALGQDS